MMPADCQRLLRLHMQAGRIAETRLGLLESEAIVHALEQDLILILMTCLSNGVEQKTSIPDLRTIEVIISCRPI
jgi:hypothetical protein